MSKTKTRKRTARMWGLWNFGTGPISGSVMHRRKDVKALMAEDGRSPEHHTIRRVTVTWEEER
jgi:hypothetical protein